MKSEKVLITGCGGMLGNAIYPYSVALYEEVRASDKDLTEEWLERLDVRDDAHVSRVFREFRPDLVIHLAAETNLEYCETHQDIAKDTNSSATLLIARLCEEYGSTLVYVSTAGVFDGLKSGFYTEQDQPNPIMVYGRTKYEGELHALENCPRSFVVRAGWMMGGGREKEKKFIFKILEQVADGRNRIYAVDDKWGTPTYTYDFARNLFQLIDSREYGVYHMACEGKGTRYDVAKEILHVCEREDIELTAVSSDFFRDVYFAPRPRSEMMYNGNLRKLGLNNMRQWKKSLREYIEKYFPDYVNGARPHRGVRRKKTGIRIKETKHLAGGGEGLAVVKNREKTEKVRRG